ncbi:MAG: 3-methyl-2-oxobutanoate hydroxymethyltransferase, partial [uncultured Rubrobacteraceae bacterium]
GQLLTHPVPAGGEDARRDHSDDLALRRSERNAVLRRRDGLSPRRRLPGERRPGLRRLRLRDDGGHGPPHGGGLARGPQVLAPERTGSRRPPVRGVHERRRGDPQRGRAAARGRACRQARRGRDRVPRGGPRPDRDGGAGRRTPRLHPAVRPELLGRRAGEDERGCREPDPGRRGASGGRLLRPGPGGGPRGGGRVRHESTPHPHHRHRGWVRMRRAGAGLARLDRADPWPTAPVREALRRCPHGPRRGHEGLRGGSAFGRLPEGRARLGHARGRAGGLEGAARDQRRPFEPGQTTRVL